MSEANSAAVQEKPRKKRHSLWWLNLLLTLIVFAGGVVLGLRLNTMPGPYELVNRYLPQLTAGVKAAEPETVPAPTVTEAPVPTEAPAPAEIPAPTEAAAPAEPTAPVETAAPEEAPAPVETPAPAQTGAVIGGADAPTGILVTAPQAAPAESAAPAAGEDRIPDAAEPKGPIGVDAALEAALKRAHVSASEAEVSAVFKTKDDDVTVYQVEFSADGTAYVYLVNALTGEIEGWHTARAEQEQILRTAEQTAEKTEESTAITEEEARGAALRHAGVKEEEARGLSSELQEKSGRSWYTVVFQAGENSYTYRVDAISGEILFHNMSK